jgi:hypothetical protein
MPPRSSVATIDRPLSREAIARRQSDIRKRIKRRGIGKMQPMQTLRDLSEIPPGATVRVHLLRSAIGASQEQRRALADEFDLLDRGSRGGGERVGPGHVGRSTECTWTRTLASPRNQQLTRFIYVDCGEVVVPTEWTEGYAMTTHFYEAGGGRSATIRVSRRIGRDSPQQDVVRIEAQADTYGIAWATELEPEQIADALSEILPQDGLLADGSVACLVDLSERPLPAGATVGAAVQELGLDPDLLTYLCLRTGDLTLTWFRNSYDSKGRHELGFGGDAETLHIDTLTRLLQATATEPLKAHERAVVSKTESLLDGYVGHP